MNATTIPPHWRREWSADYHIPRSGFDELPVSTFLVWSAIGSGGHPMIAARIVKPNHPERYAAQHLTNNGRMVLSFFVAGKAMKSLFNIASRRQGDNTPRYIILPGDIRFEMLDAFKIICDAKRSQSSIPVTVNPRLLWDAVGWKPPVTLTK